METVGDQGPVELLTIKPKKLLDVESSVYLNEDQDKVAGHYIRGHRRIRNK